MRAGTSNAVVDWLCSEKDFVAFRTRIDLLGESDSAALRKLRDGALSDPKVGVLLRDLEAWPGAPLKSHRNAKLLLHKLDFVADLGLAASDKPLRAVCKKVLERVSEEGPFEVLINIPKAFGGSGNDTYGWVLTDAPVVIGALANLGLQDDPRVRKAAAAIAALARAEGGWPCAASASLGRFHGPGRRSDPCPYATLRVLKMLAAFPDLAEQEDLVAPAADVLFELWKQRGKSRPYLFGIGTDFLKLRAPTFWYDLLAFTDTLCRVPSIRQDSRLKPLVKLLKAKEDSEGRYTPESVWREFKDWDFGQKKSPSRWLTFLVKRILARSS